MSMKLAMITVEKFDRHYQNNVLLFLLDTSDKADL